VGREAGRRAPLAPLRARASASWKRRRVRARSRCSTVIASPRPHGPMTPAGPMPARSARSRPPPAAQREPVSGEVVGRDSSRGQPSPKFDAGRAGCKVAAATDSDGSRASGRRARAIWALLCARALSGGARALGSSVAAPDERDIDPPSSGMPSRTPGLCTSSSGRFRAAALVILPGGPGT